MELAQKRVLVFGTGISGIGAAELLERVQAKPVLYEGNHKVTEESVLKKLPHGSQAEVIIGELPSQVMDTLDLAVLSPGVPTDLPLVHEMREKGIPIWGEVELAYQNSKGDVLAITGTNGKTTTTSLLGKILKIHCKEVYVVGNIGNAYTEEAGKMTEEAVTVAEISSFQLETIDKFHPRVSAILNITPDHLDRHHTLEEYIRVKERIAENQNEHDTCVLNYEDEILREYGETLSCKVLFFSSLRTLDKGIYIKDGAIEYADGDTITEVCQISDLKLPGRHNHENVMAAAAMALAYGIPLEEIQIVISKFTAVEHRIEYVTKVNDVAYYNDSKGTNPDAAIKGIQAMDRKTLLIAGGYDKNSSYEEWIKSFDGKVRYLVLIGQTKEKIAETAKKCGFHDIIFAETLREAIDICAKKAKPGDAVLLSPACASWGMFSNYEERGREFKEYVRHLH